MPQIVHKNVGFADNHVAHSIEAASLVALQALSVTSADVGRIARVTDSTKAFYILANHSPVVWDPMSIEGPAGPQGDTGPTGPAGSGSMDPATTTTAGSMSAADKVKLDDLIYGESTQRAVHKVSKNRILVNQGGLLTCNGVPIREIGVCAPTLMTEYQEAGTLKFLTEFPLIAQAGFNFVRLRACALFPNGWTAGYFANPTEFYKRTATVLDAASEHGLGLILTLFPRAATMTDITGQSVNTGFATPSSPTNTLISSILTEFCTRFKDHPAVAAWEIGNEYSLFAANSALPSVRTDEGTPSSYTAPQDVMTLETMRNFYASVRDQIHAIDTSGRIIMTGNGGPAGQIEKSLANYLTLLPLDNPVDTWSYHKYARNDFGSRAYSDLRDSLITINKAAKLAGKPLILGEFGQERNETYGGYGGISVLRTACEAVYKSGTQLALAWEWGRTDSTTTQWDFMFHPDNTINGTDKVCTMLTQFNDLMKHEGYVDPAQLTTTTPSALTGQGAYGTGTTVTVPNHTSINSGFGFCVSLRVRKTRDDLSNRKAIFKYGGNAGWFVGYGAAPTATIYAQVQWSDGSTTSTNNQTNPQYVGDEWVHYVFQLNQTAGQDTSGLTVYQNGVWIKTLPTTKLYNPSTANLTFFAEAAGANAAHVGLRDVRLHSRALTDNEARNLYLYGTSPQNTIIGNWSFDGNLLDSSSNANHGTATTGVVTYNT